MKTVLVTGAKGQLGMCIRDLEKSFSNLKFIFKSSSELDIINQSQVNQFFKANNLDYVVNCAAYTNVDKAEVEPEEAHKVNVLGVENLALACQKNKTILIHISTDFVFDGEKKTPYLETDVPNPLNIYGKTKLLGEKLIRDTLEKYFIIRTSWLYSEYGSNFLKTVLRMSKEKNQINLVNDQIGTPTYAKDLAQIILQIISTENKAYGLYHYSNEGVASWYDFAFAIFQEAKISVKLLPIKSKDFSTLAKRPLYSVLDKTKIKETMKIEIPYWRDSLRLALHFFNK